MRARLTSWKAFDGLSFPHLLHITRQVLANLASDSICICNIVAHEQVKLLDLKRVVLRIKLVAIYSPSVDEFKNLHNLVINVRIFTRSRTSYI
jgi:hypothetical protein